MPPEGGSMFALRTKATLRKVPESRGRELLILALLIGDAAAGLAGRLAGGLALAAAAVLRALAHVAGFDGLDSFHNR